MPASTTSGALGQAAQVPASTLLSVEGLRVAFRTERGEVQAVDDVSFSLARGEVLAIVGESGSGKSVSAMTLMGLTRGRGTSISGRAVLADGQAHGQAHAQGEGLELLSASDEQLRRIRGSRISMIFQDPMSALTPVYRVGDQIIEQIRLHERISKPAAKARAVELLQRVGIPRASERVNDYPHQFSGGMRQRVMIAMALSCSPELLIADEPTTALDVTIQAQILAELRRLGEETGISVLLITHDLGVVAEIADRVVVMYAGRVVETAPLRQAFHDPLHPYTWGLLGSVPRVDLDRPTRLPTISGAPPSLLAAPDGCHFAPRCPHRFQPCTSEVPALAARDADHPDHADRCHLDVPDKRRLRVVNGAIGLPVVDHAPQVAGAGA